MKKKKLWMITIIFVILAYMLISPWLVYFCNMNLPFISFTDKQFKFYRIKVPLEYSELVSGLLVVMGIFMLCIPFVKWLNYLTKRNNREAAEFGYPVELKIKN